MNSRINPTRLNSPDWTIAFAISWITGILCFRFLAISPGNPDSAELFLTTLNGGVLHPPGFPLQSWIAAAFRGFTPQITPLFLSCLSLIFASIGAGIYYLGIRKLGFSSSGALLTLGVFYLFPHCLNSFVQPEKYALTFLTLSLFFWASLSLDPKKTRSAWICGGLFGLAIGAHSGSLLYAPLGVYFMSRQNSLKRSTLSLATAILIPVLLYSSLLWRTQPELWPDWGKLASLSDVYAHFTRKDLAAIFVAPWVKWGGAIVGISIAWDSLWDYLGLGLLFLIPAWSLLIRDRTPKNPWFWMSLTLFLSIVALSFIRVNIGYWSATGYLGRHTLFLIFVLSPLLVLGLEHVLPKKKETKNAILFGIFLVFLGTNFVRHFEWYDQSQDQSADWYREALGLNLPNEALYVGGNDSELFYGALTPDGRVRFPIAGDLPWFLEKVAPLFDSRFPKLLPNSKEGVYTAIENAFQSNIPVYSSDPEFLRKAGHPIQARGVLWIMHKSVKTVTSAETVSETAKLCRVVEKIQTPLAKKGHFHSRTVWSAFSKAFLASAAYLSEVENTLGREIAMSISAAIEQGGDPQLWIDHCKRFRELFEFLKPVTNTSKSNSK